MLNPGLQHCQIKLPWVTTVNVYLLNDPLSAHENISLVFCATWKRAGQRWLQKTFSRVLGTVLSSGAHVCPFVPPLCWGGLRLWEFGLEREVVDHFSTAKGEVVACTESPWDPCASCRWTPKTWVQFSCNHGCKNPVCCVHICVGMLSDGNPTIEYSHSLLKWCCSFWRQLSVWSHRAASLPATSSFRLRGWKGSCSHCRQSSWPMVSL